MSWLCHIAGCNNCIRHIENRFSPYFILCSVGFDERRLSIHLLLQEKLKYSLIWYHRNVSILKWFHHMAAPCNVTGGWGMTCYGIPPNVCHVGILHLVSILTISSQSRCHSAWVCEIQIGRHVRSAILNFRGQMMGCLKSPCRSSIKTIALNCIVFVKIVFFAFLQQTDRLTNRWTASMH